MKSLAIIIPVRAGDDPAITLHSLGRSEFQDFSITIQHDEWGNANKARNAGFRLAPDSEFVLFSDADIDWDPKGIGAMVRALKSDPRPAYAFGGYEMGGVNYCMAPFDADVLRRRNLASTMSVIRREVFEKFMWDEELERLQDHRLWLAMLNAGPNEEMRRTGRLGYVGVNVGTIIFSTARRDGITQNGKVSYAEAWQRLKEKHSL